MKNAFGNLRQLLQDVALHPVMGFYLNTKGNQKENASTGRLPDENFARSDGVRLLVTGQTWTIESRDFTRKPMSFDAAKHSTLAASFLGVTIPANTPARPR